MTPAEAAGDAALSRCVACGTEVFASVHWGRTPLLSRASEFGDGGAGFADLFGAAAVDELVSVRGLRTPFLRMAKDGRTVAAAQYTRPGGAGAAIADQAADDLVLARVDDGATLVLQGLHRVWPPLVGFGARLAGELGHPVQVNAYVTPPANQGFAAHYDVHDVFVLQVAGRKQWTIHEPVLSDPLPDQPWEQHRPEVAERAAGPALIDVVLEPGDTLYLPRGTVHSAQALGETSIHLTVGIHPLTRYDLARHLLEVAQREPALRTSLPACADLADPAVLVPHLDATVAALRAAVEAASADEIARRVETALMGQTRPEPIGPLAQLVAAEAMTPGTPLRLRTALRSRVSRDEEHVTITLLDRTITLPAQAGDAIKTVFAGAPFTAADLTGLDAGEQLVVARRLLREGVIVQA